MGGLFIRKLEKLDGDAVRVMQIYHLATCIGPLIVGDGGTDGLNVMIFGCGNCGFDIIHIEGQVSRTGIARSGPDAAAILWRQIFDELYVMTPGAIR